MRTGGASERSPAIVLATRPLGEADLLVVLLTPGRGKVRAAARHARNSRRRFPGGLSGGAVGEATIAVRTGGLSRLEGFVPARDHSGLGRDLTRFAYVAYLCELTDALLHEPEPDPGTFAALSEAIGQALEPAAPPDAWVLRRFELRLLQGLGLVPSLSACAVCGDPLAPGPTVPFDETRGGTLCLAHGRGAIRRMASVIAAAQRLLDEPVRDPSSPGADAAAEPPVASPGERRALRDLVSSLLQPHLRRPLRSREFFAKLGPRGGSTRSAATAAPAAEGTADAAEETADAAEGTAESAPASDPEGVDPS